MNVLIIPEDFRKDEYILKPIFRRLFRSIGKPQARVQVCHDPRLGGIGEAMKSERIVEIVNRYEAMTDVFILCVDRDGVEKRRRKLDGLERKIRGRSSVLCRERLGRARNLGAGRTEAAKEMALGGCSRGDIRQGAVLRRACQAARCSRRPGRRPQAPGGGRFAPHRRNPAEMCRGLRCSRIAHRGDRLNSNAEILHRELVDVWALYDNWRCAPSRSRSLARFAPRAGHRLVCEGKMSDVHGASFGLQPAEQLMPCSPTTASSSTLALLAFETPGPCAHETRHPEPAS